MLRYLVSAAVASLLAAQSPPAFEVASIHQSAAQTGQVQAGLQITQAQVRIAYLSLRDYLAMAFRLRPYQVSGPSWLASARFDINAKLPDGVPPQQIPEMLQTLFADRFKLRTHLEKRDTPVYALRVAKSGLAVEQVPADRDLKAGAFTVGGSGSAAGIGVDLGRGSSYSLADNKFVGRKLTMVMLAQTLTPYVGRPVVDMTGVEGFYDLTLPVTQEDYQAMLVRSADAAGVALPAQALRLLETTSIDSLLESLRKAGLTLEQERAPLDMLVVDQIEKTPTEN